MYGYKIHELDSTSRAQRGIVQLDSVRSFDLKRVKPRVYITRLGGNTSPYAEFLMKELP
jgi:hypothetical protein